jgi:hypothetical protein
MVSLVRLLLQTEILLVCLTLACAESDAIVIDRFLPFGRGRSPDRTIVTTRWIGLISCGVRVPATGRRRYRLVRTVLVGHGVYSLFLSVRLVLLLVVHTLSRHLSWRCWAVAVIIATDTLAIEETTVSRRRGPADGIVAAFASERDWAAAIGVIIVLWETRLHCCCCDMLASFLVILLR